MPLCNMDGRSQSTKAVAIWNTILSKEACIAKNRLHFIGDGFTLMFLSISRVFTVIDKTICNIGIILHFKEINVQYKT